MSKDKNEAANDSPGFWARRKNNAIGKTKKILGWPAIEEGAVAIRSYSGLLDPRNLKKEQIVEEFADSCKRFSVDSEKLREIYNGVHLQFYCATLLFVSIMLWMMYLAISGEMFPAVVACAVLVVPLSIMTSLSFRMYQLSIRDWCDFGDWMKNSAAWWPISWVESEKKRSISKKTKK